MPINAYAKEGMALKVCIASNTQKWMIGGSMESRWFRIKDNEFSSKRMAKTLSGAFSKTIEKWELIIKGYMPTESIDTCGLCDLFNSGRITDCELCPIYKKTGKKYCLDTPFSDWWFSSKNIKTAKKELEFLKKLKGG